LIWHLYDYYLRPGGGYFGTRKACEPLHVQYSYDDGSVVVVNGLPSTFTGLKVSARVYDLQLTERLSRDVVVDVAADGVTRALVLPQLPGLTTTYFVRLGLHGSSDEPTSENFYWLSTQADVLDWAKSDWYFTPVRRHADLTALARLPATSLDVSAEHTDAGLEGSARVRVSNTGPALAFQVRLKLTDGVGGPEILPVFWDDNYLALMPGESREVRASYRLKDRKAGRAALEVEGWNVPKTGDERRPR
jgi:exo-1,4-beta-D-glucosaminidase